jgi:alkylated DNA repair dioxygenase AlkB
MLPMCDTLPLLDAMPGLQPVPMADADVRFQTDFYRMPESERIRETLMRETAWRQEEILLWGKLRLQPRLCAWYGDADSVYRYSGLTLRPHPWTPCLQRLRVDVEQATGCRFNSVLLNLYRDRHDSVGWHSDDEAQFGPEPAIASLSFGETRLFRMRHRTRRDCRRVDLPLSNGSLLLMAGRTQACWQHAIEKQNRVCGPRINLTFRQVVRTA